MTSRIRWIVILTAVVAASALPAYAQQQTSSSQQLGFGLRGGFSLNPDQLVVGGQFALGQRYGIIRIVPSVDVGFFDNVTTIMFNGDLIVNLKIEGSNIGLYGGAGPTIGYVDPEGTADGRWDAGMSLIVGTYVPFGRSRGANLEARFGIWDIPDFKLMLVFLL